MEGYMEMLEQFAEVDHESYRQWLDSLDQEERPENRI